MEHLQLKLTELHNVVNEIDEKNAVKTELKADVLNLIKDNHWEKKKFSIGNRYVRYRLDKSAGGITQKYLYQALKEYYNNDLEQTNSLYQYLLDNRPVSERETLEITKKKEQIDDMLAA